MGTPASRTPTTWHGSSPPCSMDTPHRRCSTPATPSGAIGAFTMRQALARFGARIGYSGTDEPLVDYWPWRMATSIARPPSSGPGRTRRRWRPPSSGGRPGTRAPHVTVAHDSGEISTIDLYGERFVLLAGSDGIAWTTAAERVADELGAPLDAYRFGIDLIGTDVACARNRIHRCCARASRRLRGLAQSPCRRRTGEQMERALRSIHEPAPVRVSSGRQVARGWPLRGTWRSIGRAARPPWPG